MVTYKDELPWVSGGEAQSCDTQHTQPEHREPDDTVLVRALAVGAVKWSETTW